MIMHCLANADEFFVIEIKQKIVDPIFSQKLVFKKNGNRNLVVNEAVALLCRTGNISKMLKKRQYTDFGMLSWGVEPTGLKSNFFGSDLMLLASLRPC